MVDARSMSRPGKGPSGAADTIGARMPSAMHENPSADKFDPPPAPSAPESGGSSFWRIVVAFLIVASYPALLWLESFRGRGRQAGLAAFATVALSVLHYILNRTRADQRDGTDPYTPPTHLTR